MAWSDPLHLTPCRTMVTTHTHTHTHTRSAPLHVRNPRKGQRLGIFIPSFLPSVRSLHALPLVAAAVTGSGVSPTAAADAAALAAPASTLLRLSSARSRMTDSFFRLTRRLTFAGSSMAAASTACAKNEEGGGECVERKCKKKGGREEERKGRGVARGCEAGGSQLRSIGSMRSLVLSRTSPQSPGSEA
jgi:hypothetical protein